MATHTRTGVHAAGRADLGGSFFLEHGFTESPIVVQCYLTLRCDMACPHCLAGRDDAAAEDMSLDLFDRLFLHHDFVVVLHPLPTFLIADQQPIFSTKHQLNPIS